MSERSAKEWASYLASAIKYVQNDGWRVEIVNDCCQCYEMNLCIMLPDGWDSQADVKW